MDEDVPGDRQTDADPQALSCKAVSVTPKANASARRETDKVFTLLQQLSECESCKRLFILS